MSAPSSPETSAVNLPNALTVAGYCASLAWVAGGPPWLGVAGLVADELDGRVARATGTTSDLGSALDWAIDVTMTGLVAQRAGFLWALPFITVGQAVLRQAGWRPSFGSARAVLTMIALERPARGMEPPPSG